jgi:predicted ATPase
MLKRIYIDNFRGLVNFELNVDSINLFLGGNGSGKSTVFEALRKIQTFISGDVKVEEIFKASDCTRWQNSPIQKFELEISGNGSHYKYELAIRHNQEKINIEHENLSFENQNILKYENDEVQIIREDGTTLNIPASKADLSLLSFFGGVNNQSLNWFIKRIERFIFMKIIPDAMTDISEKEDMYLNYKIENFASWYRYISHDQGKVAELIHVLQNVLNGFISFKFEQFSENNISLKLRFLTDENKTKIIDYRLSELSDGQKVLLVLYTLIYCTQSEDYTLCIDEPENFLALPEIQPWLRQLYDFCDEGKLQALLISHHPECINYLLASPIGYWFERQSNAPVRVRKISNEEADDSGLKISELIARGWL